MQVQNQCRKLQGNQNKNWRFYWDSAKMWQQLNGIELGILPLDLGCKEEVGQGKKRISITQRTSKENAWKTLTVERKKRIWGLNKKNHG